MIDPAVATRTIEAYASCFSAKDRDGWLALFAPDATLEDPVGSEVRTGHEQLGEFFDQTFGLASELRLVLDRPVTVCGSEAVMVFHAESKVGDSWLRVDIVDHFTLDDDGRIRSQRAFWDPASMRPLDG